jgi:hypothetical protein
MKKFILAFFTLCLSLVVVNTTEAATPIEENSSIFIENLKKEHPDWVINPVTQEEVSEIREEMATTNSITGSASPVTALYIDQVGWDLETTTPQIQYINNELTSAAVRGITGVGVVEIGYGNDLQWLGAEQITYNDPTYLIETSTIDFDGDTIVDGFFHVVYFDSDVKIPSGSSVEYRFQSTSINYPWNTMTAFINIPHQ